MVKKLLVAATMLLCLGCEASVHVESTPAEQQNRFTVVFEEMHRDASGDSIRYRVLNDSHAGCLLEVSRNNDGVSVVPYSCGN